MAMTAPSIEESALRPVYERGGAKHRHLSEWRNKLSFKIRYAVRRLGTEMGLGALPDFLIIGAQRCGTTSLYNCLVRHPKIVPALRKEVHYFDNNYDQSLDWYKAFFPLQTFRGEYATASSPLRGEATPYYLYHPHAYRRIAQALPTVKLIVVLRNPVDRAYSHYWHEVRMGFEHLAFREAVAQENERIRPGTRMLLRDEHYRSVEHQHFSYVSRGIYHQQLRRYLGLFDRDQMLVVISQLLFTDPRGVIRQVFRFLKLDCTEWRPRSFPRSQFHGAYPLMKSAVREHLIDYFRSHNEQLSELLGTELDWSG
jgi:hypothetical protein